MRHGRPKRAFFATILMAHQPLGKLSGVISVTLRFDDLDALQDFYEAHLSKGRAFVAGAAPVSVRDACELVLEEGSRSHRLRAEVVHVRDVDPGRGVGCQLAKLDEEAFAALKAFVGFGEEASPVVASREQTTSALAPEGETTDEAPGSEDGKAKAGQIAQSVQERIRNLSGAEQLKLAGTGTLVERTTLERLFGPTVWESLLRNPRLTIPEAARIAKKASLPRPLIDVVASNAPWLASGEVQRALLSNPRSSSAVIMKVLAAMSRHDLQLVPQQTAYPEAVRAAAKRRLGR